MTGRGRDPAGDKSDLLALNFPTRRSQARQSAVVWFPSWAITLLNAVVKYPSAFRPRFIAPEDCWCSLPGVWQGVQVDVATTKHARAASFPARCLATARSK